MWLVRSVHITSPSVQMSTLVRHLVRHLSSSPSPGVRNELAYDIWLIKNEENPTLYHPVKSCVWCDCSTRLYFILNLISTIFTYSLSRPNPLFRKCLLSLLHLKKSHNGWVSTGLTFVYYGYYLICTWSSTLINNYIKYTKCFNMQMNPVFAAAILSFNLKSFNYKIFSKLSNIIKNLDGKNIMVMIGTWIL